MLKKDAIESIERTIRYEFADKQLISQAFTRSSYHNEHHGDQDNEILEFIGDSVLSIIVVNIIIDKYTGRDGSGLYACRDEGDFSMLKSALVNKQFLAKQMSKLCLHDHLRMSIGDEGQGVCSGKSVLEDLFESIVGAVYLDTDRNLKKTESVINNILDIDKFLKENDGEIRISYKNDVQEWCQRYGYDLPTYTTQQTWSGFISYCEIEELGMRERGEGHNRKEAENNAAEYALQRLEEDFEPEISNYIVSYENAINMLQEYCRQKDYEFPHYETIDDEIHADNSHTFTVRCYLNNRWIDGTGNRVKAAKKQAAYNMLKSMGVID
ncbi:MAG: hypothetical protein K2M17_03675 [Bacilli bacterium]|nr:hypothetical protein [Bacilli bacterium]